MSDESDSGAERGEESNTERGEESNTEQKWERTPIPFIAALAVVLVVVAYIVISSVLSPAEDNVSDAEQIRVAAHQFVVARAGDDDERKRDTVCTGFDENAFKERVGDGTVTITDFAEPELDADRATAEVTTERDGEDPRTTTWTFVRDSDDWVVC